MMVPETKDSLATTKEYTKMLDDIDKEVKALTLQQKPKT